MQDGKIVEMRVQSVLQTGLLGQLEGVDVFVPRAALPLQPDGRMGTLQVSKCWQREAFTPRESIAEDKASEEGKPMHVAGKPKFPILRIFGYFARFIGRRFILCRSN